MTQSKLTEIIVILDRSGSMSTIKDDMEGGLWSMIQEQHGLPGKCRISLYRFDDKFEVAFEGKDSGEINQEDCRLVPRGSTALNDAIVKSLHRAESRILAEDEDKRPDLVVVSVITDGHENASTEVKKTDDVRAAISRATDKFGWKFAYLAADDKGFDEGIAYTAGLRDASVGAYSAGNASEAHARYSSQVKILRSNMSGRIDVSKPKK